MASILTQLAQEKSAGELRTMSKDSLKWLMAKIADVRGVRVAKGISNEKVRQVNKFILGGLYCFYYNPKGKMDLPYYDQFPMVLALEKYNDGFLGLNFHYLPIKYRVVFLDKLMNFAMMGDAGEIMRMRVTYDILTASKRLKEFKPCIKRYLSSHIQSKILTIQPNEWDIAALLPLQQFKGATAPEVWQDSVDELRKN
jgi:hypothetical protein|tara:strand:- start:10 stop:603 length:594 start_codon:yes stop_codon:yes gene_type:complete